MPVPQTKIYLGTALSMARALRYLPNASGDFNLTVSASPAAKWLGSAGDLDGDGQPDFIFGAPGDDDKALDAGRVLVQLGAASPGATLTVADSLTNIIIDGVNAGDQAGAAVGSISDLNGDGRGEILVGAPGMENGAAVDAGAAFVVWGMASPSGVDLGDPFSAGGADLNRDGVSDLVIGTPDKGEGGFEGGAVYVVWGGGAGTVDLSLVAQGIGGAKVVGDAGSLTGATVSITSDVDGDGTSELMIGARGSGESAYVLFSDSS